MSSLEDLLNSDSDDNNEDLPIDPKNFDLEKLLAMKDDDDEDDPAVLSSTIYEQFSHLMKTNENIQKELAAPIPLVPGKSDKTLKALNVPLESPELDETIVIPTDILLNFDQEDYDVTGDNSPVPASGDNDHLKRAEEQEQKLLHHTEKANVSALQIRRGGGGSSGSVMMGLEELTLVTNQLKKNGSYQQHGPGTATAISICPKFVAVGTLKGFIIIFDHNQEIRKVLTHPSPIKGSTAMAIVGLDSLWDGSMIVSGHRMGDVLFWDCLKGVLLKQIKDPSGAELVSLKFLRNVALPDVKQTHSLAESDSFHVIGVTNTSVVNRYRLSKSLLSTWHVEIDCLLDDSASQLLTTAVLLPCPHLEPSNAPTEPEFFSRFYSDLRKQRGTVQLFAFSFQSQSCVVQSSPEIRILFKWPKANLANFESKESRELLDWNWMKVPNELNQSTSHLFQPNSQLTAKDDVMLCPVLTRVREAFIELLVVRVKRTTSSFSNSFTAAENTPRLTSSGRSSILMFSPFNLTGAAGGAEEVPSLSFEFIPWVNKRVPYLADHILAFRWIKTTHLVAFTKTEVMLFDYSLNSLEKCLLFPPISNGFIATMDTANTLTSEIRPETVIYNGEGFILTTLALYKTFTRSPFEQANSLISSGRWLEGLSLIVENITKSPALLITESEHIRRYIINYTLLAVKRSENKTGTLPSKHSRNHYHLVASVCSEYCVATRQFSLLFQEIMDVFRAEHQHAILLESFEPFILNGSLPTLPLPVLHDYLVTSLEEDKLSAIEKCLVALNPRAFSSSTVSETDIVSGPNGKGVTLEDILYFLFSHRLFSSFLYLHAFALQDFSSAFQFVFQFILCHLDRDGARENGLEDQRDSIVYKLLLFVLYTFEGKVFPKGSLLRDLPSPPAQIKSVDSTKVDETIGEKESDRKELAQIVSGYDINAIWALLDHLTSEEFGEEKRFSSSIVSRAQISGDSIASQSLESHYLRSVEFPILSFFLLYDIQTLFSVLLKGVENLVAIVCQHPIAATDEHHVTHHVHNSSVHVIISPATDDPAGRDKIFLVKEPLNTAMKQKNEGKIMSLLYKIYLFAEKDHHEGLPELSEPLAPGALLSLYFKTFASVLISLTNAVMSVDLLTALIRHYRSQLQKPDLSPKKCEEQLRVLLENQMKLLTPNNTKLNIFADKCHRILFESEFYYCCFFVRRFHPRLFSSAATGGADFAVQTRHYLELHRSRSKEKESAKASKPSHAITAKEREKETLDLCFQFVSDSLDFLEKERDNANIFADYSLLLRCKEQILSVLLELMEMSPEKTIQQIVLPFFIYSPVLPPSAPSALALLIEATKKNSQLQFHFLQELVQQLHGNSLAPLSSTGSSYFSIRQYFRNSELLHFVRLFCVVSPESLLPFLKQFIFPASPPPLLQLEASSEKGRDSMIAAPPRELEEHFPLDEMAAIAREYPNISDVTAFFEEKFGRFDEALAILLRDFSGKLKTARKEIDQFLRQETAGGMSGLTTGASSRFSLSKLLLKKRLVPSATGVDYQKEIQDILHDMTSHLATCRALRYTVLCISELCERQSPNSSASSVAAVDDGPENATQREIAERLWCNSFDHFLKERRKPRHSSPLLSSHLNLPPLFSLLVCADQLKESVISSSGEITSQFLTFLLQDFMNKMKALITAQEIISRVMNHASSNSIVLGEFKEIMNTMIHMNNYELMLYENMKKILFNDVKTLHRQKIQKKVSAEVPPPFVTLTLILLSVARLSASIRCRSLAGG